MSSPDRDRLLTRFGLAPDGSDRFVASIPAQWALQDRIFGGYSAALCCAATVAGCNPGAAVDVAGSPRLLSAAIAFTAPAAEGPICFEIAEIKIGRSVGWLNGTGYQHGRRVMSSTVSVSWPAPGEKMPITEAGPPAELQPLDFLGEAWPFARNFDERVVDYPPSQEKFADGRNTVSLWTRALDASLVGDGLAGQLCDLAVADAHLLDAVCRASGVPLDRAFSVDLHMVWAENAASSSWRRVDIVGAPGRRFGVCHARVLAADGSLRAWAIQQGCLLD